MLGVDAAIPPHIEAMWKDAYIKVAQKYGFDLLGAWGPEISLVLASYLLVTDTLGHMPEEKEETPVAEPRIFDKTTGEYTPDAARPV